MAKSRQPANQLPEYGTLLRIMEGETASILTDYVRQYIGVGQAPGTGIFINFDRVQSTQSYKELAQFDLYAEVERDPHVWAILDSAKLNVAGTGYDVSAYVAPGKKKAEKRDEEIASFVREALDGTGYFPQHLYNLMGALGMGFAVSEIVWKTEGNAITIDRILNRPQRRFQFDSVDRSLRLRDINQPWFGTPLPDKKFMVHRCTAQWDNPFGDALDQSIYWMWLFKKTASKFWLQHLNTGASSVPVVKHPQGANAALKAEALSIAEMIRNGAFGRIPDNFEIIWAEASNAGITADAYNNFIRHCNDEMSKCVNGQTLTSEASSGTGTGTRALGEVHQLAQSARDIFRCHGLEASLNATLVKWLVDFNFAGVEGYPRFRFDLEDPEDLAQEATIVKTLGDAGFEFDPVEVSEKFNWTLTRKQPLQLAPAKPENTKESEDEEEPEA